MSNKLDKTYDMTTKTFLLKKESIAFLLSISMLVFSCKKDPAVNNNSSRRGPDTSKIIYEQAYPNSKGILIGVKLGTDSSYLKKIGDKYIWLGDIVLNQKQVDSLVNRYNNQSNARTFHDDVNRLWPNAEVFFTISTDFDPFERAQIVEAINHWEANTPIRFIEWTSQPNYIRFVNGPQGSGFYSTSIGMNGGEQTISLEDGFITGNVIHEIGHNIGFYHEQCRTDRGNAINVFYNNVVPQTADAIYQFQTYTEIGRGGFQIGDFDFGSIMLYPSFASSDGIHPVMTRLDGTVFGAQRDGLSAGDITTANYLYRPIFAKVVINNTFQSDPSNMYELRRTDDVFLQLYSDAQLTQPLTLQNRLKINCIASYRIYNRGGDDLRFEYYTVIMEPGESSHFFGTSETNIQYDPNMNAIDGSYENNIGFKAGVGYLLR